MSILCISKWIRETLDILEKLSVKWNKIDNNYQIKYDFPGLN